MNPLANPILITQRRLVHRTGVLAPVLIAVMIGLCMLVAFIYQRDLQSQSPKSLGHMFYGWLLVIQTFALVLGGFSRISRTLVEERRAGLFDSNRLTPLRSSALVSGYWLGAATRECYIALVLSPVGLAIVLLAGLPVTLWLGTQALLITTALLFGLLAVLAGMAMTRALGGFGLLLGMLFLGPFSATGMHHSLMNFLLPVYATLRLFDVHDTVKSPHLFGLPVPPLLLTWALQLFLGVVCWRSAVGKVNDPSRPAFSWRLAVMVFAVLTVVQYGLIWSLRPRHDFLETAAIVYGASMLLGLMITVALSLKPDQVRIMALRMGDGGTKWMLQHCGPTAALALAATSSAALATLFVAMPLNKWVWWLVALLSSITAFVSVALLVELCRLHFRRKTTGFIALGAFVLYILPFVLALVFTSKDFMCYSLFTPGMVALAEDNHSRHLWAALTVHILVVIGLATFWWRSWRRFLRQ